MKPSASSIRVVEAAGTAAVTGVGRYRYIAMLAEGGMADVFLAITQDAGFEKLVVIKQLRESLAEDPSFIAMFMDEARLAARLNHPNVVQTLEVGTDAVTGIHFLAMEFLEGVAYARFARLKDRVPPPIAIHLRIIVELLRGLHYAHELKDFDGKPLNVVHRDVSPQNVVVTFAGGVKVLDFGIAKATLAAEVRPGDFKGKLEYMAPEQARRESVDRRADVYAAGVMLFEALARKRRFQKEDDKLALVLAGHVPDVLAEAPGTPRRLAAICTKAMAADPNDRYPTADLMADEIEEWLATTSQHVSPRDVGAFVAEKFATTRAKINAAIDSQLALFRALQETAPDTLPLSKLPLTELPPADPSDASLDLPPIPPPPAVFDPSEDRLTEPLPLPPANTGEELIPTAPRTPKMARPEPPPASTSLGVWQDAGSLAPIPLRPEPPRASAPPPTGRTNPPPPNAALAPRKKSGALVYVLFLATALGSGAFGLVIGKRTAPPTAPVVVAPTSPAVEADAGARESPLVELTIRATPAEATLLLDDVPLVSNPVRLTFPRDHVPHVLRVEATGYEPREASIELDHDVLVVIDLRPHLEDAAPPKKKRPRPTASAKPADAPPEPEDPYKPL